MQEEAGLWETGGEAPAAMTPDGRLRRDFGVATVAGRHRRLSTLNEPRR